MGDFQVIAENFSAIAGIYQVRGCNSLEILGAFAVRDFGECVAGEGPD
ncbi:MAG: hypothetical protein ACRC62_31220 [Microcoleus sp.]